MQRVLGLDIGTNSVGWAVIDLPEGVETSGEVIALGSRIFPEGAEQAGSALVTKGQDRRTKRSQRRQIARRSARRRMIRRELTQFGLLPESEETFKELLDVAPMPLLTKAENGERLELTEIGRVLYWFAVRRGFLSLRSGGSRIVDEDDESATAKRYRRNQFSAETGELIVKGTEEQVITFLQQQQEHHPSILTKATIFGARGKLTYPANPLPADQYLSSNNSALEEFGLHGLLFFQRSVYWRRSTIGLCSLDPKKNQPRAARAERQSQTFRIWKTITDMRIGKQKQPLTDTQRQQLFETLQTKKTMTFGAIRKLLKIDAETPINLETENRKTIDGHATDTELTKRLGDTWEKFDESTKSRLVFLLLGEASEEQVQRTLETEFKLSSQQAESALNAVLQTGRMNYSRQTIKALLTELPTSEDERSAIISAGFQTPEQARADNPVDPQSVTNPRVRAALSQVEQVVKSVSKEYGLTKEKPFDAIRIELARDVRANAAMRAETTKWQSQQQKQRKAAIELVSEHAPGSENSRDSQRRMRLWVEQGQQCLYTGKPISPQAALSPQTEIDHILPRSQTLNDSMNNIALVFSNANQQKGERTIYEWSGIKKVEEVADRAKAMGLPRTKIKNVETEHIPEDSIPDSLLITTGYINAVARDQVKVLTGITPEVSRGRLTAQMRYRIGLKKDQTDHRRHAYDAAMVALTTPSIALNLAKRHRQESSPAARHGEGWGSWEPWKGARTALANAYENIIVSHRAQGRIRGQWHEDTRYGKINSSKSDTMYARRRNLSAGLSAAQFKQVADPVVKSSLLKDLMSRGIDPLGSKLTFDPSNPPTMPDGQQIMSVRCHANLPSNFVLKPESEPKTTVSSAGNYRAYIYQNLETQKHRIHIVDRFAAFKSRDSRRQEQIDEHIRDDEHFRFSVSIGESLAFTNVETQEREVSVVTGLSGSLLALIVCPANDSSGVRQRISTSGLNNGDFEKVVVTPAGLLRWAND